MADHFEKAKDAILLDAQKNGGVEPHHILTALCALADDNDDAREEAREARADITSALTVHCVESREELDDLQEWRKGLACMLSEEHEKLHQRHVEEMHLLGLPTTDENGDVEESKFRVRFMWLVGSKVAAALVALLLSFLVVVMTLAGNIAYHYLTGG